MDGRRLGIIIWIVWGLLIGFLGDGQAQLQKAPVTTGSFTVTGTGFADPDPTGTAIYVQSGPLVALFIPTLLATSDATTFTLTGLPAAITPTQSSWDWPRVRDNTGNAQLGALVFTAASTTITLHPTPAGSAGAAWTASGQKAHFPRWYVYALP